MASSLWQSTVVLGIVLFALAACVEPPMGVGSLSLDEPSWTAERVRTAVIARLIQTGSVGNEDERARELVTGAVRDSGDWSAEYVSGGVWRVSDGRIGRAVHQVPAPDLAPLHCPTANTDPRCEPAAQAVRSHYPGQFFDEEEGRWLEWGPAQGVFAVYESTGQVFPANEAAATFLNCLADYDATVCAARTANVRPTLCVEVAGGTVRLRPPGGQHDTPYMIQDGFCGT